MSKNISLMGANYPDVPAVTLPQTGGGSATFNDVSDTTATESDVLAGKYFYKASGERVQGSLSVPNVIDNLNSTSSTDALSANQGKVLDTYINALISRTSGSEVKSASDISNLIVQMVENDISNDNIGKFFFKTVLRQNDNIYNIMYGITANTSALGVLFSNSVMYYFSYLPNYPIVLKTVSAT